MDATGNDVPIPGACFPVPGGLAVWTPHGWLVYPHNENLMGLNLVQNPNLMAAAAGPSSSVVGGSSSSSSGSNVYKQGGGVNKTGLASKKGKKEPSECAQAAALEEEEEAKPKKRPPRNASTLLTDEEERTMIEIARTLIRRGDVLLFEDYQDIARDLFERHHPDRTMPAFSKEWFRGFVNRWPDDQLWAYLPDTLVRKLPSKPTRSSIKSAFSKLREQLNVLGNPYEARRVYFATDVMFVIGDTNRWFITIGDIMPRNLPEPGETHRITALTFANFDGKVANMSFSIPYKATPDVPRGPPAFASLRTTARYNWTGTSECDKDGEIGTYHLAIQDFVRYVSEHHKDEQVILIVDSKPAHEQECVKKMLEENNILQVILTPELTRLVQKTSTQGTYNGIIRHRLTELRKGLRRAKEIPAHVYCPMVEGCIAGTFTLHDRQQAAHDFGLELTWDENLCPCLRMDDHSITRQLDKLVEDGWIEDDTQSEETARASRRKPQSSAAALRDASFTSKRARTE